LIAPQETDDRLRSIVPAPRPDENLSRARSIFTAFDSEWAIAADYDDSQVQVQRGGLSQLPSALILTLSLIRERGQKVGYGVDMDRVL